MSISPLLHPAGWRSHLRAPPAPGGPVSEGTDATPEGADELSAAPDVLLLCRRCRHVITSTSARTRVEGKHLHAFANPSGILFEIGCFRAADGVRLYGVPSADWTWFRGTRWTIAVCGGCLVHLGWAYDRGGLPEFFGLILSRLVEGDRG